MEKKKLRILGIIGARSGSKGLKNKNIKSFNGKPLISRIIGISLKSKYINRLIVSTDSKKYAQIARSFGAEIPYIRPKKISTDKSHELEFIKHLLKYLKQHENYIPSLIVRLLTTVPFQKTEDIDKSISKILKNNKLDSCFVISDANQHPLKALKINKQNNLVEYFSGSAVKIGKKQNRNLFQKAYFRSNIVVSKYKTIQRYNSLAGKKNGYHIIPSKRSIDIDTKEDFNFAEYLDKNSK